MCAQPQPPFRPHRDACLPTMQIGGCAPQPLTAIHKDHYHNLHAVLAGAKISSTIAPPTDMAFLRERPLRAGTFLEKRSGEGAPARGMQPDPGGVPVPWPKLDVGGQRGACSYASGCPVPLAGLISRVRGFQGGGGGSLKCATVPAPSVRRRGRYLVRGQILHGAKKVYPRLARHAQIWKDGVALQVDPPLCPRRCTRPWTD